jgi:hypothetical protein
MMKERGNGLTRRQFLQLGLGLACGLALWRVTRARVTLSAPIPAPGRTYGSGVYSRGTYGKTAVYLPLVTKP